MSGLIVDDHETLSDTVGWLEDDVREMLESVHAQLLSKMMLKRRESSTQSDTILKRWPFPVEVRCFILPYGQCSHVDSFRILFSKRMAGRSKQAPPRSEETKSRIFDIQRFEDCSESPARDQPFGRVRAT